MIVQWYPGHMKKTKELIIENLKLVDIVIEILDARLPISSRNPIIDKLTANKPRIIVLNKVDLADSNINNRWKNYFEKENANTKVIFANSITGQGVNKVTEASKEVLKEKLERNARRGIKNKPIRAMIVGIPNVGKSTFINKIVGKGTAKTGNKPGVTKAKQWIKLKNNFELLDTPGILWPKFEDMEVGLKLSFIGSIKDDIIDLNELAYEFVKKFKDYDPTVIEKRYGVENVSEKEPLDILNEIAINRKFLAAGAEPDITRVAKTLMTEFREGVLGKISLEKPEEFGDLNEKH